MTVPDFMPSDDINLTMITSDALIDELKKRFDNGFMFLIKPLSLGEAPEELDEGLQSYGEQEYTRVFWGNAAEICTHLRLQSKYLERVIYGETFGFEFDEYEEDDEDDDDDDDDEGWKS